VIVADGARPEVAPALQAVAQQALETGELAMSEDRTLVATPAVFGDKVVGVFATATTAEFALAAARTEQKQIIAIALAMVVLGILGIMLGVRYLIARPITELTGTVDEITRGNLDIEVPGRNRGDELGQIATSMERLRGTLAEASAAKVENQFRGAAFRASASAMMMVDGAMKVIHANEAIKTMLARHAAAFATDGLKVDPDAIVGNEIAAFFPTEMQRDVLAALNDPRTLPRRFHVALGEVRLQVNVSAVDDDSGNQIGFVAEWHDVSESFLNAAVLGAIDSSQVRADFGIDGALLSGNAQMLKTWGMSTDDIAKMPPLQDVPGLAETYKQVRAGKPVFDVFPGPPGPDGTPVLTDGVLTPVMDENGQLTRIVLIGKDVTATQRSLKRADAERAAMQAAQEAVVDTLRRQLGKLREGDLTTRIETAFGPEYEQLRADFNQAAERLQEAMRSVVENAEMIRGEANEISSAADDLSSRTERQAATLEETAAASTSLRARSALRRTARPMPMGSSKARAAMPRLRAPWCAKRSTRWARSKARRCRSRRSPV
jgi:methyl-accepting chemotaxis protein